MSEHELFIYDKAFDFAKRVVKLYKYLCEEKRESTLSKQLLRSGTSIGANIKEAKFAQSKNDYISKLSIALKEANESEYWIDLLDEDYLNKAQAESLRKDNSELIKLLVSSLKKAKND